MTGWWWGAVSVAGAAGAVCRYVVDFAVSARISGAIPLGTLVVNVTGSLLFGFVAGALGTVSEGAGLTLAVGFCGAYTTFSTHMAECLELARERRQAALWINVVGSLVAGVVAASAGLLLGAGLA